MTADSDLIRRGDALAAIRRQMKNAYTAARKQGYKESFDALRRLPGAKEAPVVHSHWFYDAAWIFCHNCGGKGSDSRCTPYCPWCGARMDEETEIE